MADITQTVTLSWSRDGESIAQSVAVSADGERNANVTVPASTTDLQIVLPITVASLKLLYIWSDVAVMFQTNSGSVPDNTLNVAASKPLIWYSGSGITNPLTTDVTSIYITNATGGGATVKIRTLQDTTP